MFDIGGWEFLIVIVIAIIVIGPKDLPGAIRTVTGWIRRARELAREFQSGIDDLARETDMDNVKNEIQSGLGLDEYSNPGNSIRSHIENMIDPDGSIDKALKDDNVDFNDTDDVDGPFSDNSFEEDEELDGAEDVECEIPAEDALDPPSSETPLAQETLDGDVSDNLEQVSAGTDKKPDK